MKLGEIVNDSIIENKEKTKCYWEQLMTANCESDPSSKKPSTPPSTSSNSSILKKLSFSPTDNAIPRTKSSLIEKEIQLQKERELDFAREQEETRSKLKKISKSKDILENGINQGSEALVCNLNNIDDGNHSEYGSEDKEDHSLEDGVDGHSLHHHQRTRSLDSMSSGHSSASGSGYGSLGEPCVRRRPVTVKPLDEPNDINILEFVRNEKETPIEREIRLSKEREDELRRDKGDPIVEVKSKDSLVQEVSNKIVFKPEKRNSFDCNNTNVSITATPVSNERKISLRKEPSKVGSTTKGAIPKIFLPNPNQKGLMKRFIASRGRLSSTFVLSSPASPHSGASSPSQERAPVERVSTVHEKKDLSLLGVRPGYVSAEDKIQVELREMRKREEELRKQQMARSQPDLLSCFESDDRIVKERKDTESEVKPVLLRSAVSTSNLLDSDHSNQPAERSRQAIKRSSMIDVWESMIQKN